MKLQQLLIFMGIVAFASAPTVAQAVNPANLKINGVIGLRSTYAQVIKTLGKPASESKPTMEQCTGGYEKTADYTGAMFYFMNGPSRDGKTFEVESFIVSSPKWTVSGVKVGDAEAVVTRKYGRRFSAGKDPETGARTLTYEMGERRGPGQTTVTVKNGKVVKIASALMVC